MVEKPEEGICSQCGTEELEFYDDGSGSCRNCGRVFRWNHEVPESDLDVEIWGDEIPSEDIEHCQEQKNTGFTPSRPPRAATRIKPKKGFLSICTAGIILLIVGYVMIFMLTADAAGGGDILEGNPEFINIALMLNSVGVLVLSLGLIYGATNADHLDSQIRAWMLIAMALILSLFLSFGTNILFGML